MRILHVTPSYYPAIYWGGPIFSVYGLNNVLAVLPDVVLKVITTDSAGPRLMERLEVGTLDLDALYPGYMVYFTRRIFGHSVSLELLMKLPALIRWADVVHLTATYSFPTIPTLLLCRIWNKPLIWSPRGALLELQNFTHARKKRIKRMWNILCNLIIQPSQVILHATSETEKIASSSQIPNAKAVVIRNGVESPITFPKRQYLHNGKLRLLFIGRLHPIKGIENLLQAVKQLDDPTITLSICGDGNPQYVSSLKKLASQLDLLEKGVHFFGKVDGDLKTARFLNADACVIPSYSENSAMVVTESLAYGVPVIVSHGTPWQDVVARQCGLWVDNSPESLVGAIRSIRQMDLAEMGDRGWKWMKDEFRWEVIGLEMFNLYKSICS